MITDPSPITLPLGQYYYVLNFPRGIAFSFFFFFSGDGGPEGACVLFAHMSFPNLASTTRKQRRHFARALGEVNASLQTEITVLYHDSVIGYRSSRIADQSPEHSTQKHRRDRHRQTDGHAAH
jgi:hypothetical protein